MGNLVIGVDPGRVLRESEAVALYPDGTGNPSVIHCGGLQVNCSECCFIGEQPIFYSTIAAVIVEWPHSIPGSAGKDIDRAIRTAAIVADRFHLRGVRVFTPGRQLLLSQLGRKVREKGNQDKWLSSYLEGTGYRVGPWTVLKNTHRRAALAAALFNYNDPRNSGTRYNPDEEE